MSLKVILIEGRVEDVLKKHFKTSPGSIIVR
jgi:hypothetical protein